MEKEQNSETDENINKKTKSSEVPKNNKEPKEEKEVVNEIIMEVHQFRNKHLEYARDYIFDQALKAQSNSNIVGTGGTPFMKYLDKHLQETLPNDD